MPAVPFGHPVRQDRLAFIVREKLASLRVVRQENEDQAGEQDGRDAFEDKDPKVSLRFRGQLTIASFPDLRPRPCSGYHMPRDH